MFENVCLSNSRSFLLFYDWQITDNSENVFSLELGELSDLDPTQKEVVSKNMINHLRRLASERDDYSQVALHPMSSYNLA